MGSVGLSFGSATSGQGIDVANTVTQILANYQAVETPWKNQLTALQSQDTVLSTLGTQVSTLSKDIQTLTDATGVFEGKTGSSSDTNVLELSSASALAAAATHSVTVQSLAQTSSAATSAVGANDTLSGGVTIQVGSGSQYTVNVGDSSTASTISGLAAAINAAGIGVTATVLTDSSGSRLSVVSSTSGAAGNLTVSGSLIDTSNSGQSVTLSQVQVGKDASLEVDGLSITSPSNTVTNAIPGVTFQLLSANAAEPVQVVIANDNSSIESGVSTFVNDYNTLIKSVTGQEGNDSSGNAEPLYGNPVIAQLQDMLEGTLSSAPSNGNILSLYSLGITTNSDGTLSLNSDTLDSALNSNFSDVQGFFQNAGSFGASFASTLNSLGTTNPVGVLALTQKMNASQESTLSDDISNEESRLSDLKTKLTTELNEVNQTLQAIPSQINYVNELYSAISGYNDKSS
jgi:flagellar hook-associated protein 2